MSMTLMTMIIEVADRGRIFRQFVVRVVVLVLGEGKEEYYFTHTTSIVILLVQHYLGMEEGDQVKYKG